MMLWLGVVWSPAAAACALTHCGSNWCYVCEPTPRPTSRPTPQPTINNLMTDSNFRTAVTAWLANATAAEATYGHISTWETGGVTDMSYLFSACSWYNRCNTAAASFNEDIGPWDTSGVTRMDWMFAGASAFN